MKAPGVIATLLTAATIAVAGAQSRTEFEVVSIKRNDGKSPFARNMRPNGGTLSIVNLPITALVGVGYPGLELVDAPAWVRAERYDVTAKYDPAASDDEVREMAKKLVAERLKFKGHEGTREARGFSLVVDNEERRRAGMTEVECPPKSGTPTQPDVPRGGATAGVNIAPECGSLSVRGNLHSGGLPMKTFILDVGGAVHARVDDDTGLKGYYKFLLRYSSENEPPTGQEEFPTFLTAMSEQLGLKITPKLIIIKTLIVDNMERPEPN